MILYQDEIINSIDAYSIDTFPRSILLEGLKGSGKSLICNYIADKLGFELVDISDRISNELIDEIYIQGTPAIYKIDGDTLSISDQNAILKFIEEPLKNSFIIVTTSNHYNLLPTISNRCILFILHRYSEEELENIRPGLDKYFYHIFDTPGELDYMKVYDLVHWKDICLNIIDNVSRATFQNTLSLDKYVTVTNEKDKLPCEFFVKILKYCLKLRVKEIGNRFTYKAFDFVKATENRLLIPNINKLYLFQTMLIQLYKYSHEG